MKSIKLSKLDPNCNIVSGSKHELACAEMLLFRIYNKMRYPKTNIALLNNKNYIVEIDVKKEDIVEGFKCWVCGKYLGESEDAECPNHSISEDENFSPEYTYFIRKE